jgi:HK97 family phage portal protein
MAFLDYIPFLKSKNTGIPTSAPLPNYSEKEMRFIEKLTSFQLNELADYDSYLKASTEKVWASFKACDITSTTVLQTQYDVIGKNGNVIENKELDGLIQNPNPYDTFEEILYLTTFHLKTTGNAFWLKDEMDSLGRPKSLYPLLPQHIKIRAHEKSKIADYEYNINGKKIVFKPEEIIHFKRPHANDSIFGLGDIGASEPLFNKFMNNDSYSQSFFKNGAFPSGVLVREEYDGDEVDFQRFKRKWASEYTGTGSQGKTAWLNGKWSYIQLGLSNKELQTIEQSELNTEQIFLAHGVPLSVAGIKEASNYATARQEYINFRRHTVLPMVKLIFSRINHNSGFIRNFNKDWTLSYKLSGLIDVEQAAKDYELLVKYGAMTLNEYRVACGMDESSDENHGRYYTESTRVPLEIAGAESILMSERFRLPSDQELDSELQDNEIQLPDDPELKEDRENEDKGFGGDPDSVYFQNKSVVIIDPTKEIYKGYEKTAKKNAKRALAYKKAGFTGGTLKMWAISRRIADGKDLSLEQVKLIASKVGLIKEKTKSYEDSKFAVHLDALGGTSGIRWAKNLIDEITKKSINWSKLKEKQYYEEVEIDDNELE